MTDLRFQQYFRDYYNGVTTSEPTALALQFDAVKQAIEDLWLKFQELRPHEEALDG